MTTQEFINDSIPGLGVSPYMVNRIRFHARACHNKGRSEYIMLRQVARNHGYNRDALELARKEWANAEAGNKFEIVRG